MIEPVWQASRARLYQGHALSVLKELPANSVHACITSAPYWGLREYGTEPQVWGASDCEHEWGDEVTGEARGGSGTPTEKNGRGEEYGRGAHRGAFCGVCGAWRGELGLEPTLALYLEHLVAIFEEVRRVLHPRGTLWLNHGDSWACSPNGRSAADTKAVGNDDRTFRDKPNVKGASLQGRAQPGGIKGERSLGGALKEKDLVGQAWALAFALRDAGWYLRDAIIWHKPGPMPASVRDRTTCSHEYVFMLSKSPRYFFDAYAVRERAICRDSRNGRVVGRGEQSWNRGSGTRNCDQSGGYPRDGEWRNRRSVWTINTEPSDADHYAAYPKALVKPMVLAGTSEYGCCASCHAPYERVVERSGGLIGRGWSDEPADLTKGTSRIYRADGGSGYRVKHKGWRKVCRCATTERVSSMVLDPFCGTGTTGLVALEYGRRFTGIELLPKHCKTARKRLQSARLPLSGMWDEEREDETETTADLFGGSDG